MMLVQQRNKGGITIRQLRKVKMRRWIAVIAAGNGHRIFEVPGRILALKDDILHVVHLDLLIEGAIRNLYNVLCTRIGALRKELKQPPAQQNDDYNKN